MRYKNKLWLVLTMLEILVWIHAKRMDIFTVVNGNVHSSHNNHQYMPKQPIIP